MSIIGEQLRFVSLAEAAERAGRSQRQVQRWAEEQYGAVRKRRQGRIVEYCLDDVLEVVGASPVQRKLTRLQEQVAQGKTEREALEDQVRHWKKKLNDFQARAKENYQERDAQITSLEIRNASLQAENSHLRLSQGTVPTTVAGSLAQPVKRDWSVPVAKRPQTPPWQTQRPASEPSLQAQLTETQQKLHECQHIVYRWKEHATQLETTLHQVREESQNRVEHNAFLSQMLEDLGDIAFKSFDRSRWASRDDLKAQFQELFARVSPVLQRARKDGAE